MPSSLRSNTQSGVRNRSWVSVAAIGSTQSGKDVAGMPAGDYSILVHFGRPHRLIPGMAWWRRGSQSQSDVQSGDLAADPGMPVIRLDGITKIFRGDGEETRALEGITVDIARGEYVSVSGPSGCGKSTFLSILALLDTPTGGRYWLNGRATDRLTPGERARVRNLDIGLVFQSFNLIGDMTVYENVEYPLSLRGVPPAERKDRVDAALARVGLTARAKQRPGSLSGGHQQLVAVARAITGRPAILLADEPTGNL